MILKQQKITNLPLKLESSSVSQMIGKDNYFTDYSTAQ